MSALFSLAMLSHVISRCLTIASSPLLLRRNDMLADTILVLSAASASKSLGIK